MDTRIQKAYDIIKKQYQDKILLADLAGMVELSPFFFQRLFKKEMKETPLTCLNRIRLDRAAHLMRIDTTMPLSGIAIDCGFSSLSTFSRAFSNKFGISPSTYLKADKNYHLVAKLNSSPEVGIVYHPGATVLYTHTSFYQNKLLKQFKATVSFCELNGISTTGKMIGILTHISFHGSKEGLNYYAGVEVEDNIPAKYNERIFKIPAGKYACFSTDVSYHEFTELMVGFKLNWLDRHSYLIREIFAFEEIDRNNKNSDYPFIKRKVYVPIKNK